MVWLYVTADGAGEIDKNPLYEHYYEFYTKIGYKKYFNIMITKIENRYVLKIHVVIMRPIFDTTYKRETYINIFMRALHHEMCLVL